MKGLLQRKQAQQPNQQQTAQPGEQGGQQDYDMAAGQIIQWLASDEGYNASVQAMSQDPAQGIAMLIGRLLQMTNQSAYMAGKKLDANVLFQAGMEAARAIATIGLKEGILDKQTEARITEDAFFEGLALFAEESQSEALTNESKQQFLDLIDGLEKMMSNKGGM